MAAETRIQRCLCREVDEIWQYRVGGNLTTFNKDYGAVEEGRSRIEAFATIAIYSWWQCTGGEAGRANADIRVEILAVVLRRY